MRHQHQYTVYSCQKIWLKRETELQKEAEQTSELYDWRFEQVSFVHPVFRFLLRIIIYVFIHVFIFLTSTAQYLKYDV